MGARKLTEPGRKKNSKRRDLESRLWVVFDLRSKRAMRPPARLNEASAFLSARIRESLLNSDLSRISANFLAVAGHASYPGRKFPEEQLAAVSADADSLVKSVLTRDLGEEVEARRDRYTIRLCLAQQCDTAERWIESHRASDEGGPRGVVRKVSENDLKKLLEAGGRQ